MVLNGTNTIYARDNNSCSSSHATAIQLGSSASELTIEDSWAGDATSGRLAFIPASGKPSIDLNGANSVIINGTQLELHNADKMAIAHMEGETEKTDGSVKINDGTIIGESSIGLPQNTLIDGGTFNAGTIVCYNRKGKTVRPFNSRGEVLARSEKEKSELPDWYGQAHLTEVAGRVYPMLFGGEGLCIFEDTKADHNSQNNLNWTDDPKATSDAVIMKDMDVTGELEVKSLTINEGVTVTVNNGATLTIGDGDSFREQAGNLHVANGGKVQLTTGELIVNNFYLDAELGDINHNGRSGQVHNMEQLAVNGDAYFDLALDPSGECSPGWYDFTVPFPVDAVNGITRFDNSTHLEKTIKCETNYAIMDFAESRRVETGYGWKKYHSVMQPGQCYTITIDDVDNIYRFKKTKTGAFNSSSTTSLAYSDVQNANRGWNCLGNGTLEYANISVEGIEKAHVYNHATNSYTAVPLNEYTYVVGSAYMIQTPTAGKEITYTHEGGMHTLRAPRRSSAETEFTLSLSREGNNSIDDRLYVGADEDATYNYEIGRELTKFAAPTDSKVAQVWANAYGLKLCDVEMPLVDNEAEVTLSFFAPKAGSYTLAIDRMPEDEADLYLTYNGLDIWNLTTSPYTIELAKGTTEGYGLRIQSRNTPQITTGVDEINGDKDGNRKVMVGNEIYIITKEGAIFNATGKKVK